MAQMLTNVFKEYRILDLKHVPTSGKVFPIQDTYTNKRVLQLTNANLRIPLKNVHSNFVSFQIQPQSPNWDISITYIIAGIAYQLKLSDAYTQIKHPTQNSLEIPVCIDQLSWNNIILDSISFLNLLVNFKSNYYFEIFAIDLVGSLKIKNILIYHDKDIKLPKDLMLHSTARRTQRPKDIFISSNQHSLYKENIPPKGILKKSKYMAPLGEEEQEEDLQVLPQQVSPAKNEYIKQIQDEERELEQDQGFKIQPAPLLQLQSLIGHGLVKFLSEGYIVYTCGCSLVVMNVQNREQKYCFASKSIQALSVGQKQAITITNSDLIIWDCFTCTKIQHYQLHIQKVICIDTKDDYILVTGQDNQNRFIIYFIKNDTILVRQVSTFHIAKAKIIDKDRIVAVGKENIRIWHFKGTLQGHCPYLGNYARECNFVDVCVQGNRILAGDQKSKLFVVSLESQEVVGVWALGESTLYSLLVHQNTIISTHSGHLVKCWKKDFSEVIFQMKLHSDVISTDTQANQILCVCVDGTVGIVQDKKFTYLLHRHLDSIVDVGYHDLTNKLISISRDQTIRVWNLESNIQEYSFRCIDASTNRVVACNSKSLFIAAFDNGLLRIFDLKNYKLVMEVNLKINIVGIAINENDTLILATGFKESFILNSELQILKINKLKTYLGDITNVFTGFSDKTFFIGYNKVVQLFSVDTLEERGLLTLPGDIKSCSLVRKDLLVVIEDEYKRSLVRKYKIDKDQTVFQQEIISKEKIESLISSHSMEYIFAIQSDQFLNIWDYKFRGDLEGNPDKQTYKINHPIQRILLSKDNLLITYAVDEHFILIWQSKKSMKEVEFVEEDQEEDEEILEKNYPTQRDKQWEMDPNALSSTNISSKKKQKGKEEEEFKGIIDINEFGIPLKDSSQPEAIKTILVEEHKEEKIHSQSLGLNKIYGYTINSPLIQPFPWNVEEYYYVLAADRHLVFHYFKENKQVIVSQPCSIQSVQRYKDQLFVLLNNLQLRIYQHQQYVKTILVEGEKVLAMVPSDNYLLLILQMPNESAPFIQILEVNTARVLATSLIQGSSCKHNIFADWCGSKADLMFVVISSCATMLWRLTGRAKLEYLELQPKFNKCAGSINIFNKNLLFLANSHHLNIVDINQTRVICSIANLTQQEITQVVITKYYIILLTLSPNIYFLNFKSLEDIQNQTAQIISVDTVPVAYAMNQRELLVACKSGQVWFVDLHDRVTLKLHTSIPYSHHANQNLWWGNKVLAATSEGSLKIWHNHDFELEFLVPKRQCTCVESIQKQTILVGYDDGYIRLYRNNEILGHCLIEEKIAITYIKSIPNSLQFLTGTDLGDVYLCNLNKDNNEVRIKKAIDNCSFSISQIDYSEFEGIWAVSTKNGKIQIFSKKKISDEPLTIEQITSKHPLVFYLLQRRKINSIAKLII